MVSIAAFQAVDPGSIPGRRKCIFLVFFCQAEETACRVSKRRPEWKADEAHKLALWRNGSASDSRSEGYVFKSHWGQFLFARSP